LAKHLEDHPSIFVIWDNGCIARGKDYLDDESEDDLITDMLDFVDKGGYNPSSNNPRQANKIQASVHISRCGMKIIERNMKNGWKGLQWRNYLLARNLSDSNLNGLVGVHIQSCLRSQCRNGLPDYAGDEQNDKMYCEFFEHRKEMVWENWVFRNREVVDESTDEDDNTDRNGGSNKGNRI
jgi:hypothetical protein